MPLIPINTLKEGDRFRTAMTNREGEVMKKFTMRAGVQVTLEPISQSTDQWEDKLLQPNTMVEAIVDGD